MRSASLWLLPAKAGLCLRFRRNTQHVLRLILPTSGTAPLEQDGFTVELLPKLAFFTLWDAMILRAGCPDDAAIADEGPADDAQAPIDLVSDSESTGDSGDSDDSSDVAVVEPVESCRRGGSLCRSYDFTSTCSTTCTPWSEPEDPKRPVGPP